MPIKVFDLAFKADLQDWTVITEFKTKGADGAIRTATEVATAANMTPEQVETVLSALDYASDDIDKVLAGMRAADSATANPKVRAQVSGMFLLSQPLETAGRHGEQAVYCLSLPDTSTLLLAYLTYCPYAEKGISV